jgi:hypothetical protein
MQPRNTVIMFIVAVLLGAFVYLYEIEGEVERGRNEEVSRQLFPEVDAAEIGFLLFRAQGDQLVEAIRLGEEWHLKQPVAFPGDDVNLNSIASTLANLTSETEIEDPASPEVYGLGGSGRRVQFRAGDMSFTLQVGNEAPVGGNIYVAREDALDRVFTVAAFRVSSFDRDVDSLRDKRVLSFDRARVERVVVGWPGGTVTVAKTDAGWQVTHPSAIAGRADVNAIDDLLSDISFLRAEGFVDDIGKVQKALATEPHFTVALGLEGEEGAPLEVGLRVVSEGDEENYLLSGGHARALYRVPRDRVDGFPRDVFAYRFKAVSNFDSQTVDAFELVFQPESPEISVAPTTIRVERTDTGWESTGDAWLPGKAAAFIAEFSRLDATSVAVEQVVPDELVGFGLAPPRVTLRAFGGETESAPRLIAEVFLGELDPAAGFAAMAAGQAKVVRIDSALAEQIPMSLTSVQRNFLAPPSDVQQGEGRTDQPASGVPPS